ncbi:MoaE-domain-containing protein [Sistotremastrum niveocremeum HHB9708]|uniref:MoaE-domain-containing protein n=1 Tax=Sistotremastrum niveocremeum HHB9708 TaxID=1314777 RepID=A0A164XGN8_9AGAM|nr:MoaE-domain-containing protein [Sistotremastrum niveocremeum HHB9708]
MTTEASYATSLRTEDGICSLTYEPLDVSAIIASVGDKAAGAQAIFIGTTRDNFQDKTVTRLEYQAYSKLAVATIANIIKEARQRAGPEPAARIIFSAVHHRLGEVPVGQASIVIAVSSPHRKQAFVACEYILEEVKAKAQIWKREYYVGHADDEAQWKSNNAP